MLVSVKSAVKGYHVYRNEFPEGTILECLQEPENEYSESAIIVKKGETVVGHVPEGLCQLFTKLFNDECVVNRVHGKTKLHLIYRIIPNYT